MAPKKGSKNKRNKNVGSPAATRGSTRRLSPAHVESQFADGTPIRSSRRRKQKDYGDDFIMDNSKEKTSENNATAQKHPDDSVKLNETPERHVDYSDSDGDSGEEFKTPKQHKDEFVLKSILEKVTDLSTRMSKVEKVRGRSSSTPPLRRNRGSVQFHNKDTHIDSTGQEPIPTGRPPKNVDNYVEQYMRAEDMALHLIGGRHQTKLSLIPTDIPTKPFMYLPDVGYQNKMKARTTMQEHTYTHCFLKMVADDSAILSGEPSDYLSHLERMYKELRAGTQWERVRDWSQHILDQIGDQKINWDDDRYMDIKMIEYAFRPASRQISVDKSSEKVPCRDFNQKRCSHSGDHQYGSKLLMHACSYCFNRLREGQNPPKHSRVSCIREATDKQRRVNFNNNGNALPTSGFNGAFQQDRNNTSKQQARPWITNQQPWVPVSQVNISGPVT